MHQSFLIAALAFAISLPVVAAVKPEDSAKPETPPNMGHAPSKPDGIGRLDVRLVDPSGGPVEGAHAKLESRRQGGFFCESWAPSHAFGQAVLPPLHVGQLTLIVKAKGFETVKMTVRPEELAKPIRLTLSPKK